MSQATARLRKDAYQCRVAAYHAAIAAAAAIGKNSAAPPRAAAAQRRRLVRAAQAPESLASFFLAAATAADQKTAAALATLAHRARNPPARRSADDAALLAPALPDAHPPPLSDVLYADAPAACPPPADAARHLYSRAAVRRGAHHPRGYTTPTLPPLHTLLPPAAARTASRFHATSSPPTHTLSKYPLHFDELRVLSPLRPTPPSISTSTTVSKGTTTRAAHASLSIHAQHIRCKLHSRALAQRLTSGTSTSVESSSGTVQIARL